jgi:hypothetical protein
MFICGDMNLLFVNVVYPYPALPLTVDHVFEAVKTVTSWRKLAQWLMGWYSSIREDRKKLDAIELEHVSDEARLNAVVEAFLLGEGKHQPSWRMLIHRLHWVGESHLAEKIKTNAEPHQGEWVSADVEREMINGIVSQ